MNVFFRALSEYRGEEAPARIFGPFYYHVMAPKISKFVPKDLNIFMLCFLVIFFIKIIKITIILPLQSSFLSSVFFSHTPTRGFLSPKTRTKVPEIGGFFPVRCYLIHPWIVVDFSAFLLVSYQASIQYRSEGKFEKMKVKWSICHIARSGEVKVNQIDTANLLIFSFLSPQRPLGILSIPVLPSFRENIHYKSLEDHLRPSI